MDHFIDNENVIKIFAQCAMTIKSTLYKICYSGNVDEKHQRIVAASYNNKISKDITNFSSILRVFCAAIKKVQIAFIVTNIRNK